MVKHNLEIEIFRSERMEFEMYSQLCEDCAQKQSSLNNKAELCGIHAIARRFRKSNITLASTPTIDAELPETSMSVHEINISPTTTKQLDYISKYLRNGRHYNGNESGRGRRIRHNSVEQLLQRMMSVDEDEETLIHIHSPETNNQTDTIHEELSDLNESADADQLFVFPTVDKSKNEHSILSVLERKKLIQDELVLSRRSVTKGVELIGESKQSATQYDGVVIPPEHLLSQQALVKQALGESRAGIIKSLGGFDTHGGDS